MGGLKECDVEGGVESSDLMQLRYLIELISGTTRISESRFDPTTSRSGLPYAYAVIVFPY